MTSEVEAGHRGHLARAGEEFHAADAEVSQNLRTDAVDAGIPFRRRPGGIGSAVRRASRSALLSGRCSSTMTPYWPWRASASCAWSSVKAGTAAGRVEKFGRAPTAAQGTRTSVSTSARISPLVSARCVVPPTRSTKAMQHEVAVGGGNWFRTPRARSAFRLRAVMDQVGDGADLQSVLAAEGDEFRQAGHGAVVVHDLADDGGGLVPGQLGGRSRPSV